MDGGVPCHLLIRFGRGELGILCLCSCLIHPRRREQECGAGLGVIRLGGWVAGFVGLLDQGGWLGWQAGRLARGGSPEDPRALGSLAVHSGALAE